MNYSQLRSSLPWKFFRKLAFVQLLVTVLIAISTAWMARYYLKTYIVNQAKEQLTESLSLINQSIQTQNIGPLKWCASLKLNWRTRYTLINEGGRVLCDNYLKPELLDNQLKFKEVKKALKKGKGSTIRFSPDENISFVYGAILINSFVGGSQQRFVIRQAVPLKRLDKAMKKLDRVILIFLIPLLFVTFLISLWASLQVSAPLRSILEKVEMMKRVTRHGDTDHDDEDGAEAEPQNIDDEWTAVEKTLDLAQAGLSKYLDELYNENEKMSTVMESISDSILAIGLDENILFANKQFKKNFLPKEIKRKSLSKFKLWEVNRNSDLQKLFNQVLLSATPIKDRNIEIPIKGGKRTSFFDIQANPLFDQKGEVFGAVGVFHDVTERRMAEQMREDFVANVSHEVRTPLTAMKGFVQILKSFPFAKTTDEQKDQSSNQVREFLEKIENNSDRLTLLFNDILNLSVIESKKKVDKETLYPKEITESVLSNVRQGYREKDIEIHCEYEVEKVWGNPLLLEQVLTNLIDNAFKYSPTGGNLRINWSEDGDQYVVLKVSDSGMGIGKEHLPRLFERFYRVDQGRSRDIGGTGLGLAIVKHIVQAHNGKLNVESDIGKGTVFTLHFPAHY